MYVCSTLRASQMVNHARYNLPRLLLHLAPYVVTRRRAGFPKYVTS